MFVPSPHLAETASVVEELHRGPHLPLHPLTLLNPSVGVRSLYRDPRQNLSRTSSAMAPVSFWTQPLAYTHWAARAKPAILWSIVVGSLGPLMVVWKEKALSRTEIRC